MGKNKRKKKYDSSDSSNDGSSNDSSNESSDEDSNASSSSSRDEHPTKGKDKSSSRSRKGSSSKRHKHKKTTGKGRKQSKRGHVLISDDDYFKKSSEFRSWLSNERGIYFSDLSSTKSRKLFSKFVRKWNSQQLKKKYYEGIQSASLEHSSQTNYKWKIADRDDIEMGSVRDRVSSWTGGNPFEEGHEGSSSSSGRRQEDRAVIGPMRPPVEYLDPHLKEESWQEEKKQLQKSRRDYRKHNEMVMDELLPKATGHEARIEKRRTQNQRRREREISPDIDDSSLMGSGDRIRDRIKSKQSDRERRAQIATQKISDYKEKEKSKIAAILEMAKANKKEGSLW